MPQHPEPPPPPPFALTGKVAVVTGGASGIGQSVALLLARQGAHVCVLDRDAEGAGRVIAQIRERGGQALFLLCDVSSAEEVARSFSALEREPGRLDILVNNAGIAHVGNLEHTTESDLDRIYAVNVKGAYHCSKEAISLFRRSGGGVIINLSSIAALVGLEDRFAYSMSKGAITSMTLSIARDYLSQNIRCNCVCPARVHTP